PALRRWPNGLRYARHFGERHWHAPGTYAPSVLNRSSAYRVADNYQHRVNGPLAEKWRARRSVGIHAVKNGLLRGEAVKQRAPESSNHCHRLLDSGLAAPKSGVAEFGLANPR